MVTRGWFIFRVVLPLGMAASSPVVEWAWPRNEVAKLMPVALPALMAVFHLAGSSLDRPERTPTVDEKRFRRCVGAWHALDGLACLLLMAFEMAVAVVCTMREAPPGRRLRLGRSSLRLTWRWRSWRDAFC